MTPVFIISFNRLTTLKGMLEYFKQIPEFYPVVIDNASTYPPLLEFFEKDRSFELIRFPRNMGPWTCFYRKFYLGFESEFFAFTDCDLDLSDVPLDVFNKMQIGLREHPEKCKIGVSLEVNDLPNDDRAGFIKSSEKPFWQKKIGEYWDANCDSTFALYRNENQTYKITDSLRLDRPYTARHLPWYNDLNNLSKEESYYLRYARYDCSYYSRHDQNLKFQKLKIY